MHDLQEQFHSTCMINQNEYTFVDLKKIALGLGIDLETLPYTSRVLSEQLIRHHLRTNSWADIQSEVFNLLTTQENIICKFVPSHIVMQDFTGVPALVDLAALRDEIMDRGLDPELINPTIKTTVVVDHSIQVDAHGTENALSYNVNLEFYRNSERYEFLKWASQSFHNLTVLPPGSGIIHQLNMERITNVVDIDDGLLHLETMLGTDSHTTMINSLGILGWGVGGIEAESVLLGEPSEISIPKIVGVFLDGHLNHVSTPTDLALHLTEVFRSHDLTGCILEFFGPYVDEMSVPDRGTIANMAPEYGVTAAYFPVDARTLEYFDLTNRKTQLIYELLNMQGLFRGSGDPHPNYHEVLHIDVSEVGMCIAGPSRPQDRLNLDAVRDSFTSQFTFHNHTLNQVQTPPIRYGDVVIAAITSCTNTANPYSMIAAGLLARNAVTKGLTVPNHVKTSLAPGSRVVTEYLEQSGLMKYLNQLGFHIVGYGCTTCSGSSGPLAPAISNFLEENPLPVVSVLSGNRNFPGRIHSLVQANYLASPPLVVAYAIHGTILWDLSEHPVSKDSDGREVFLKDIWPSHEEVENLMRKVVRPTMVSKAYAHMPDENRWWHDLSYSDTKVYRWDKKSTYIQKPDFHSERPVSNGAEARILLLLGDDITTDHISPAGTILPASCAGDYLKQKGVAPKDFNTFGSRRGAHEVMVRGAFSNPRLRDMRTEVGRETTSPKTHDSRNSPYESASKFKVAGIPLVIMAGRRYGSGSSRDWAAKAPYLLGVKAIFAISFERIHRANLVRMGVLPLVFMDNKSWKNLDIEGDEVISLPNVSEIGIGKLLGIHVRKRNQIVRTFRVMCDVKTHQELEYLRSGGILPFTINQIGGVPGEE